jgi:Glycosyltransferase family 87/WD40-like Beta Propeller Repeat
LRIVIDDREVKIVKQNLQTDARLGPGTQAPHPLLAIAEWLLLAALVAAFIVSAFLPAWRTMNTDFPNYYLAASLHRHGIPLDRAYDWRWFQRYKDHLEIDQSIVGFAPHPPMCALPMLPLALLPPLEAKRVWLILNLDFLALALWILHRVTRLPWRRILLLSFLCILPLRENFLFGQYYLLILLLICIAYYAFLRGHRFTCGVALAAAASLKIFPAFFLILFLRKRDWRSAAGLIVGGIALAATSVIIFGWDVHRIYLLEVLPRALHGDLVGPYTLQWNSFTALCHKFLLAEPGLNPSPLLNSPWAYALVQACLATGFLFSFLFSTGDDDTSQTVAWEWSTFLVLLILLSSMPTAYHHCVLIFTAIVAITSLLEAGRRRTGFAFLLLFAIACYPLPGFVWLRLQGRLVAVFLLYVLLLLKAPARADSRTRSVLAMLAAMFLVGLTVSNLRSLKNRAEDFSRRLQDRSEGYSTFAAVKSQQNLVLDKMVSDGFAAVILPGGSVQPMPRSGDVLSIAGSAQSPYVYFELTNRRSQIMRLAANQIGRPGAIPEYVAEGQDPAISPDGRWLAFIRDDRSDAGGKPTIWLSKDGAPPAPAQGSQSLPDVLEITVTSSGDIIAAAASPANPRLVLLHADSGQAQPLTEIAGPVRYPAISPDGKSLAFSRRESGSWRLFVRDLVHGTEQQFTNAACNAVSPSWEDSQTLLYASDCGRGFGLSALVYINVSPVTGRGTSEARTRLRPRSSLLNSSLLD